MSSFSVSTVNNYSPSFSMTGSQVGVHCTLLTVCIKKTQTCSPNFKHTGPWTLDHATYCGIKYKRRVTVNSLSSTQIPLFLTVNSTKSDYSLKFPGNFTPLKMSFKEITILEIISIALLTTKYGK